MEHSIIKLPKPIYIAGASTVVGHEEFEGPLGEYFDFHAPADDTFGMDTWEKAESEMQRMAVGSLLGRAKLKDRDIAAIFSGDLLNQCTSSGYGLLSFDIPFFGLYGACSTAAEGLCLGSLYAATVGGRVISAASSHYCSAERQFRYPMEYGGQRPPTAQWTVTGAAAFLLSDQRESYYPKSVPEEFLPCITEVLPGISVDRGIKDANNMGAAMAPAALDTLTRYFSGSPLSPDHFDMIVTGDLGEEGSTILCDFARAAGLDIAAVHRDCGNLIYDSSRTDKHAGGSGCGCSAVVTAGYLLHEMRARRLRDILFVGTGALMSPMSIQQGQSIPGIAHLVRITVA